MTYNPLKERYDNMNYRRCGKSGIRLPEISLGLWHNFGAVDVFENFRKILWRAFDKGITHFDLANNYLLSFLIEFVGRQNDHIFCGRETIF